MKNEALYQAVFDEGKSCAGCDYCIYHIYLHNGRPIERLRKCGLEACGQAIENCQGLQICEKPGVNLKTG